MTHKFSAYIPFFAALAVTFCIASCGPGEKSNTIRTANNELIQLEDKEKPLEVNLADRFTIKRYERYVNSVPDYQVPLNKLFFSRNCTFYYGIPIDGDVLKLYNAYLEKFSTNKIASGITADTTDASILGKDSLNYVLVEIIKTPAKNLLVGAIVSKDSSLMMSYFEHNNLRNRILNEQ